MNSQLILKPEQLKQPSTTQDNLVEALLTIGFISESLPETQHYFVGEHFFQLITFMGCSPNMALKPAFEGDSEFCHIQFEGPYQHSQILTGKNTTAPRCPHCRTRLADWKTCLAEWQRMPTKEFTCPKCQKMTQANLLEWKKTAGAGQLFIRVHNIFPGEAVPVDSLLKVLAETCNTPWRYFYIQN